MVAKDSQNRKDQKILRLEQNLHQAYVSRILELLPDRPWFEHSQKERGFDASTDYTFISLEEGVRVQHYHRDSASSSSRMIPFGEFEKELRNNFELARDFYLIL